MGRESSFSPPKLGLLTPRSQPWVILGLVIVGCGLRLLWLEDMKWKADEIWMFETARRVVMGKLPWPWLGMISSAGIPNPGASVWCFIGMAVTAADPVAMVRWVAGLNVLAIGLYSGFVLIKIPAKQQLTWAWGLAIASVNPIAIHYSRTIWAQNILPPLGFLVFLGLWYRRSGWGAFLWGLVGTLIGQVHMSGFFLQPGLVLWTIAHDRQQQPENRTRWRAWGLGTGLGLFPLLPWVYHLLTTPKPPGSSLFKQFLPEFYLQWLTGAWGLNLEHELGKFFWKTFLMEPRIGGWPTFLMAGCHLLLVIAALVALIQWCSSRSFRAQLQARFSEFPGLSFYWLATAGGMGLLMTGVGLRVPVYYLNGLFPFLQIWVAFLYRDKPRVLAMIALAQLLISLVFLTYVHLHGGIPQADYGTAYYLQDYRFKP